MHVDHERDTNADGVTSADEIFLEATGLCKDFSGVRVLADLNVRIHAGRTLGIIGENGAGKSTLVKLLSGVHTPTQGQIRVAGRDVARMTAKTARQLGITTIPQEFNLIDGLTVCENIFLGREHRRAGCLLHRKRMNEEAQRLLDHLNTSVGPDARVGDLSAAEKQMVEIAKAIVGKSKLLIMDEPATTLSRTEVDVLFALIRRLKGEGTAIVYISHRLRDVTQICDEVMILRDGRFISLDPTSALDEAEMARRMVGRELSQMFPAKATPSSEVLLEVERLTIPGLLHDITFQLHRGEVLGFAGLVGSGRTGLADALFGIRRRTSGDIRLSGRPVHLTSPRDSVRCGIAYLTEDRQGTGLLTSFSVIDNVTLVSLRRYGRLFTSRKKMRARAQSYVQRFNIRTPSLDSPVKFLSGGNQQKVALAKGIDADPCIVMLDEPTRGIDVQARHEIYAFIHQLVAGGVSCMLISSDLEELLGMCHRIIVMRDGRIEGCVKGDHMTEEDIMYLATGVTR